MEHPIQTKMDNILLAHCSPGINSYINGDITMTPRDEAIKNGSKTYITGKPCKHGHVGPRYTATYACIECFTTTYATPEGLARGAYTSAKHCAASRNIEWQFTFEEWYQWWLDSGHWEERGPGRNQYVMARYGDTGPYHPSNVRCCTSTENKIEAHLGKKEKDTRNYKRGPDSPEVKAKKAALGLARRGIPLSSSAVAKRTQTRRDKYNGGYVASQINNNK